MVVLEMLVTGSKDQQKVNVTKTELQRKSELEGSTCGEMVLGYGRD